MSYATSDERIAALKGKNRQLVSEKQALERRIDELFEEIGRRLQESGEKDCEILRLASEYMGQQAKMAKWRTLCRDMMLVVECCDLDHTKLQAHGKDADWRTLRERYDELASEEDA